MGGEASARRWTGCWLGCVVGAARVLVLRGEAGIGKTALLGYLTGRAAGFRVARCMGVESEMELAFTGLHDLCAPMLSYLDALVEPQRGALSVALGLASGEPPESFLVALAALNLLAQAAEDRPLLCVVDDVQWLDQATAQVLGFVGRRLLAEPVGLVFAARPTTASEDPLASLPDLRLSGLDERSACALLASVTTARLDESVRRRIVDEAHGNPLGITRTGGGGFRRRVCDARQRQRSAAYPGSVFDAAARVAASHATAGAGGRGRSGRGTRRCWRARLKRWTWMWARWSWRSTPGCWIAVPGCGFGIRCCGAAALARAQLADGDVAEELYRRRHRIVFPHPHGFSPRAGTTVLRRMAAAQHRRTDAATQLRRAFDEFAAVGANAFAQRTRCELEATGEKYAPTARAPAPD